MKHVSQHTEGQVWQIVASSNWVVESCNENSRHYRHGTVVRDFPGYSSCFMLGADIYYKNRTCFSSLRIARETFEPLMFKQKTCYRTFDTSWLWLSIFIINARNIFFYDTNVLDYVVRQFVVWINLFFILHVYRPRLLFFDLISLLL